MAIDFHNYGYRSEDHFPDIARAMEGVSCHEFNYVMAVALIKLLKRNQDVRKRLIELMEKYLTN